MFFKAGSHFFWDEACFAGTSMGALANQHHISMVDRSLWLVRMRPDPLNVGRIVGGVLLVGGISLIAKFRSARRHIYSRGLSGSKTIFFSRREQYGNIVDSML
jgi:hypothetical protein